MDEKISLSWEELRAQVLDCRKCELEATRKNVVFGVGNPRSNVVFIGEGPGEQEDLTGEPFVGRAGILLDKMLLAAGFSRDKNVYIANMVKCRPPQNRDPAPHEVECCIGWLRNQIKFIKPRYIVCLGRVAAKSVMDADFKVTRQHGEFVEKDGVLMMGTYHPAAILRNVNLKPDAFSDLLGLRDRMQAEGLLEARQD